jgi:hypothetical protein
MVDNESRQALRSSQCKIEILEELVGLDWLTKLSSGLCGVGIGLALSSILTGISHLLIVSGIAFALFLVLAKWRGSAEDRILNEGRERMAALPKRC